MPFPKTDRVVYTNNPLDQVICQIRFPTILKIETENPADFQEEIRDQFPIYREKIEWNVSLQNQIKDSVPPHIFPEVAKQTSVKNYEFLTPDSNWRFNLTKSFIALTTNKYEQWEDFYKILNLGVDTLNKIYKPINYTRIGLRYIDIIQRSILKLDAYTWEELINPSIIGMVADSNIGKSIENFKNEFNLMLNDKISKLKMIIQPVKSLDTGEECLSIDSDFHLEQECEKNNLEDILHYFNRRSSRLIQWCITAKLHKAMGPLKQ